MTTPFADTIRAANIALVENADLDSVEEFFSPDYVVHLTEEDVTGGPALVRRFVKALEAAFEGRSVEVEILVEAADRVAWQRTVRGVHIGAFRGFSPQGEELVWRDMLTSRFEGGRIVEEWAVSDLAERLLMAKK